MARSIFVVKYNFPLTIGEIFTKLDKRKFKVKYNDKNDFEKQIELEHKISNLKQTTFGVNGIIRYFYQKENEFKGEGHFDVTSEELSFLFAPMTNAVILHGNTKFRTRLLTFFTYILHGGDDLFDHIIIKKDKLHNLMKKILNMESGKNNLEGANFYHGDVTLENLKKLAFTTNPDFCGTDHELFYKHYENCTHWGCTLRVYRCNGLLDETSEKGYLLRINKDASVSFGQDKTWTEWNRFVGETMKPAIKF